MRNLEVEEMVHPVREENVGAAEPTAVRRAQAAIVWQQGMLELSTGLDEWEAYPTRVRSPISAAVRKDMFS